MHYLPLSCFISALMLLGSAQVLAVEAIVDKGPANHLQYSNDNIPWQAAPKSLEADAEVAVLEGNPAEAGVFTMRIKMPDGFRNSPHWHPNVERVTVLSGTFKLGAGRIFDANNTESILPGSYTAMPPEMRHYAVAEGETVIQLTSVGPWIIIYVDKQDDPRLRN